MNFKNIFGFKAVAVAVSAFVILFSVVSVVSAHVVVKPAQVGIGSYQTFTVSVPSEKNASTVELRLVIPGGLQSVTPTVKPGWTIIKKTQAATSTPMAGTAMDDDDESSSIVTEVAWIGGGIPSGQRDDFTFSAKVPSSETSLQWKAYQVYSDGSVVTWDQDPAQKLTDFSKSGPFSITKVVNDLASTSSSSAQNNSKSTNAASLTFSLVALVFSILAFVKVKKQNND